VLHGLLDHKYIMHVLYALLGFKEDKQLTECNTLDNPRNIKN